MVRIGKSSASATAPGGFGLRSATAAALLVAMVGLGGCGTWADPTEWSDPTGLFGSGDDAAPVPSGNIARDAGANADRFPNLARVPPRPVEMSANSERRQAIDSLAADRANARYTDEELRARPADSNTPPPAPRAPVTQMPSASQTALPRGAVEPAQQRNAAAPGLQPSAPGQMAQAPAGPAPAQGVMRTDTYAQSLAQSGANALPAGLAQPQGGGYSPVALPGAQQLLAIVRFGNGASSLGNDDKALIKKVAEYYKGVGNKGNLKVVTYAGPAATGLAQRRTDNVSAELRKNGAVQIAATTAAPPASYAAGATDDYSRRVEIYLVN